MSLKSQPNNKALVKELERRQQQIVERKLRPQLILENYCFPKQLEFINDKTKFKTGVCSRRAGKTIACAYDLVDTALKTADIVCLYITLSRKNAKKLIWRELIKLLKQFQLYDDCHIDNQELSIEFPNSSIIYISGAKDAEEIEKFRGVPFKKVYIDESQSFREYIKTLIDDVLENALMDYDGQLILIGTPGPICAGYFYECTHNSEWAHHHWTMVDNPHIELKSGKKPEQLLAAQRKRRGITEDDPTYQRESLGRWVQDKNALVYRYEKTKNDYDNLPLPLKDFNFIFGIDIGYEDSDAIAVMAYSEKCPEVYLVEEYVKNKQSITDLVKIIKQLQDKYKPVKMVMDAGALGKKIQEEIQQRHGLTVDAADKTRKIEFIELLNDDLRVGKLKIKKESIAAQDYNLIQWDMDKSTNGKRVVSTVFHSDIADAVLYAWREAHHYAFEPVKEEPAAHTNEYMNEMERREAEKLAKEMSGNSDLEPLYDLNDKPWWQD